MQHPNSIPEEKKERESLLRQAGQDVGDGKVAGDGGEVPLDVEERGGAEPRVAVGRADVQDLIIYWHKWETFRYERACGSKDGHVTGVCKMRRELHDKLGSKQLHGVPERS